MEWRNREEENGCNKARSASASLSDFQRGPTELGGAVGGQEDRARLLKPQRTGIAVYHVLSLSENKGITLSQPAASGVVLRLGWTPRPTGVVTKGLGAVGRDIGVTTMGGKIAEVVDARNSNLFLLAVGRGALRRLTRL